MKTTTTLSKVMKIIRIQKDISLRDMAKQYDCTPAYISSIENGKCRVPNEYFKKVCDILECNDMQKAEIFGAILELQHDYLSDLITEQEKSLFEKFCEFVQKIRNFGNDVNVLDEINRIANQIKTMIDYIVETTTKQMNLAM